MPRKRTVDDLKARATTLQARAERERHAALEAQRRLKAAEALARRETHLRLGAVVEAVLGPISPEGLRALLATHVLPSPEAASPDASAVPPQGNSGHASPSRGVDGHDTVGGLPQAKAASVVQPPVDAPPDVRALLSPGSAGLMVSSSGGARHEAFARSPQTSVGSMPPSQGTPGEGQVSPATCPEREDRR